MCICAWNYSTCVHFTVPAVNFTFEEFVLLENETAGEIRLTRSGDLNSVARVAIRTNEISDRTVKTAEGEFKTPLNFSRTVIHFLGQLNYIAGEDFEMLDTTVEFAEGVTEQVVIVNLVDDVFPESAEVFEVYLAVSPGVYISSPSNTTVFILNDDPPLPGWCLCMHYKINNFFAITLYSIHVCGT